MTEPRTNRPRTRQRTSRLVRGVAALLTLIVGLVGVPIALAVLGGNPVPRHWSSAAVSRALLQPDNGRVLVGVITVVGWLAWSAFAGSVTTEAIRLVARPRRPIRLPGLAGPQRLAASLLLAALALASAPRIAEAGPAPPPVPASVPAAPATHEPGRPPASASSGRHALVARPSGVSHLVVPGDDLWSLAERYYGEGPQWRRIAEANPQVLTGGPDRLRPGWHLTIPEARTAQRHPGGATVVVGQGDTLSAIAERELGDPSRWPELYRINRAVLSDPNELAVGITLRLPAKSHSQPKPELPPQHTASRPDRDSQPDRPVARSGHSTPPAENDPDHQPTTRPAETRPAASADTAPAPPAAAGGLVEPPAQAHSRPSAAGLAGVGGLLAAGLLAGIGIRRRIQLHTRPVGRRIPHPDPPVPAEESTIGARSRPLTLRTLDLALRGVAAHCLASAAPVPRLRLAAVDADQIELIMEDAVGEAPVGFRTEGCSWLVGPSDAEYLKGVPGIGDAVRPYPSLVTLGTDQHGREVLGNLEALGVLTLTGNLAKAAEVLAAMAVELSFSPWADEMILTLVGNPAGLPEALGKHNVTATGDADALLDRLAARADMQRSHQPAGPAGRYRIDPDLSDPWAPEIVLVGQPLTEPQQQRLVQLIDTEPRPTIAAVVAGSVTGARWSLSLHESAAELAPIGLSLTPQRLAPSGQQAVVSLLTATGSTQTTAAPWWVDEHDPPGSPPDNVSRLGRRFGGWGPVDTDEESDETMADDIRQAPADRPSSPVLALLGPVELLGARGEPPPRAGKQCLEYCGWLLEHPGTTAQAMGSALAVAEGTRRSNMSRLRTWLGASPTGDPYLPDAYSGRIFLHPAVSSDWHRLQILTARGVNRTSDDGLRAALNLVRGAPLADAAPGQWHWAEELRTDMISAVRDIGVQLTKRALDAGDLDLARWAAARALVAAPGDELLTVARIRTEHLAGNDAETERLTLQLARQSRTLGVDLDPETVDLLQQVVEGRVRARLA